MMVVVVINGVVVRVGVSMEEMVYWGTAVRIGRLVIMR